MPKNSVFVQCFLDARINVPSIHLGAEILRANERFNHMSAREQGHVLGQAAFMNANPTGSIEAAELGLQITAKAVAPVGRPGRTKGS